MQYPPPIRPERRLWRWYRSLYPLTQFVIGCLVLLAILFVCSLCSSGMPSLVQGIKRGYQQGQVSQSSTPQPPGPQWTITHTFTGNGTSSTDTFAVTGDWQLNWYCTLPSSGAGQYHITIDVDRPGQKLPLVPGAVDAFCSSSAMSGSVEEQQSGTLSLAVTSDTGWTVQIEQLI